MPLKAELDAVKKNYVKLMKLPVKDLLPSLKVADVVSDDQREQMNAMTLDKERAGYLIDNIIIATLKVGIQEPFYNFLRVLEDDDNPVVKVVAKDLRAQLISSMPPQPYGGLVHTPYQGQTPQQYPPYQGQTPQQYPPYQGQTPQQYPPYQRQTPPQQYHLYQGQMPPQQYPIYQGQTPPQQYPPYQRQTPPQQYHPYQGQTPPQKYHLYQGQMPPQQYPIYQGQTPPQQYPPYRGQTPPQQYPPYQGQTPPQQYPIYQGQTPPQQYPPYQGQTPPQQYHPYQGQTPPQQYPPYQGQTPPQQYHPYQGQTPPQQYPIYQGQMPPQQTPPQQHSPYQGHPMMPLQGGPIPQPVGDLAQMIKVENYLANTNNKGIDPLPASNRNVHAVCLIRIELPQGIMRGTGFIANFTMPNSSSPVTVLVTNHHVIHSQSQAFKATYQFSYLRMDSDEIFSPKIKGEKLIPQNDHGFYTCKDWDVNKTHVLMDYTVIQVREEVLNNIKIKSELDREEFLLSTCKFDLDNPTIPSDTKQMETICMFHYPEGQPLKRSAQGSVSVGHLLFYACDTGRGSSGGPVFKVVNEEIKLIALHRGSWEGAAFNFGTLITEMIEHIKKGGPAPRMNYKDTNSELLSIVHS